GSIRFLIVNELTSGSVRTASRRSSQTVGLRAVEQQRVEPLLCQRGEWAQGTRAEQRHARRRVDEAEQIEVHGNPEAIDAERCGHAPAEAARRSGRGRA